MEAARQPAGRSVSPARGPLLGEVLRRPQLPREHPRFPRPGGQAAGRAQLGGPTLCRGKARRPTITKHTRDFLAVQLLAPCAFTAGAQVQSLIEN